MTQGRSQLAGELAPGRSRAHTLPPCALRAVILELLRAKQSAEAPVVQVHREEGLPNSGPSTQGGLWAHDIILAGPRFSEHSGQLFLVLQTAGIPAG